MMESSAENQYESYAGLIAPTLAGGALGILFGRGMTRPTANTLALGLLLGSALVAAPVLAHLVRRTANRPGSDRGSRRRLEGIRDGALPGEELKDIFVDAAPQEAVNQG